MKRGYWHRSKRHRYLHAAATTSFQFLEKNGIKYLIGLIIRKNDLNESHVHEDTRMFCESTCWQKKLAVCYSRNAPYATVVWPRAARVTRMARAVTQRRVLT